MFDETNGSQKKQVDLDIVDDEEHPCDNLQRMTIGDVRPQDPRDQLQGHSPNDTTPPAQGLDQEKHESEDENHDPVQEESIYTPPTYLHLIQDIEDRCLLLMSSTSFVDLPFQEYRMMAKYHMDQNPHISSLSPK
jgi:hypothetical protein